MGVTLCAGAAQAGSQTRSQACPQARRQTLTSGHALRGRSDVAAAQQRQTQQRCAGHRQVARQGRPPRLCVKALSSCAVDRQAPPSRASAAFWAALRTASLLMQTLAGSCAARMHTRQAAASHTLPVLVAPAPCCCTPSRALCMLPSPTPCPATSSSAGRHAAARPAVPGLAGAQRPRAAGRGAHSGAWQCRHRKAAMAAAACCSTLACSGWVPVVLFTPAAGAPPAPMEAACAPLEGACVPLLAAGRPSAPAAQCVGGWRYCRSGESVQALPRCGGVLRLAGCSAAGAGGCMPRG